MENSGYHRYTVDPDRSHVPSDLGMHCLPIALLPRFPGKNGFKAL